MFKKNPLTIFSSLSFLVILLGFSFLAPAQAEALEPESYVSVRAFIDKESVSGGGVVRLAIEQNIYQDWHTYWLNPGDSGLAFNTEWDLPEGYSVSALEWPTPHKIPYGELTNYGYENTATLLQNLTVPNDIGTAPVTIKGKVNLLVCHDICIPETHDIEFTLNSNSSVNLEKIKQAETKLPTPQHHKSSHYEHGENFIVEVENYLNSSSISEVYLAPEEWGAIDNSANATVHKTDTGFKIIQKRGERDLGEINEFPFVVVSKNDGMAHRFVATSDPKKSIKTAPTTIKNGLNNIAKTTSTEVKSPLTFGKAFIFALLGGLVLNLMPCVFPVLSMKALSLIQLSDKEERKAKLYGLSYTAGILISFGIIVSILIGLKAAGAQIGWGFQLQNPIVISLLAYLVFLIGLSLYGFFELTGSFTNAGQKLANQSGNKGAFFTGVLATLVATPCTAPFMGAAMGYALTQGALASLVIFLALGFGLALPYLALCYIPALRSKLPKPGAWMETFRQLLSFPMFLTAAFLIWVLSQQAGTISTLIILCAMTGIVFSIWLWRAMPKQGLIRSISFALLGLSMAFIITAPLLLKADNNHTAASIEYNEQPFSQGKLDSLLQGDKAIFTNMTASWCITCKVNERIAIRTNVTQEVFKTKDVTYLKGDWTNKNAEISQYLNSFNRQGVPLYVYYGPRNAQTRQRPEPIILPQILTPNLIKNTIQ